MNIPLTARAPSGTITLKMVPTDTQRQRRSSRLLTRIRVRVEGKNSEGRRFRQTGETVVISAHGGLIYLEESPAIGAEITLINPTTEEEQDCRVVYLGDSSEKGQRVGVEFLSPAPHFWGIEFAQPDWPHPADSTRTP